MLSAHTELTNYCCRLLISCFKTFMPLFESFIKFLKKLREIHGKKTNIPLFSEHGVHQPSQFSITRRKSRHSFYHPMESIEGRVDLGNAFTGVQPMAKAVY